jgi:hypothetical protein
MAKAALVVLLLNSGMKMFLLTGVGTLLIVALQLGQWLGMLQAWWLGVRLWWWLRVLHFFHVPFAWAQKKLAAAMKDAEQAGL